MIAYIRYNMHSYVTANVARPNQSATELDNDTTSWSFVCYQVMLMQSNYCTTYPQLF